MDGITGLQKSMIFKNCSVAFSESERIEPSRQLQLYYFDQSMDCLDKALYFGSESQSASWHESLIKRGNEIMSRLRFIFTDEDSETRAEYFEKVYVKMNKTQVDLGMRLAWYIAKAYHKRSLQLHDQKSTKLAFSAINQAV